MLCCVKTEMATPPWSIVRTVAQTVARLIDGRVAFFYYRRQGDALLVLWVVGKCQRQSTLQGDGILIDCARIHFQGYVIESMEMQSGCANLT